MELEPWARCHCICLVMTHRMTCNDLNANDLTGSFLRSVHLASHDKIGDVTRGQIFKRDLSRSKCRGVDASRREEYDDVSPLSLLSLAQCIFFAKKLILLRNKIAFCLTCPRKVKMLVRSTLVVNGSKIKEVVRSCKTAFKISENFRSFLFQYSIAIRGK